ncbi:MAG: D-alanyl-D-alanine carboxypeptidase/D-alanyl-D-alanine-endopeptidase, partial [Bdellovibrionota bacterium]|nr:D-alanyl-D-alanine carboxypeptidase/D-alanyl-D-alanine-endopeptidase [Bdellovibrionota bacterium]
YTTPELDYIRLKNGVKVHKGKTSVQIKRVVHKDYEEFILSGKLSHLDLEKVYYRPVNEAARFTGENFKENLKKLGVELEGKVRLAECAGFKKELASVDSKALPLVIRDMMKYSNNFLAEIISKTIVREKLGGEGSLEKLEPLVDTYLKQAMKNGKEISYVYESVSGLSYKNRFSAEQLFNLLNYERLKFSHFYEFASALPVGGIDGTLKSRFKGFDSIRFRAKTGLLNNVVSLAGYGQTNTNKNFQFVLIYNGQKSKPVWKVQQFFDKILIDYVQKN